jgi:hypothetical protein
VALQGSGGHGDAYAIELCGLLCITKPGIHAQKVKGLRERNAPGPTKVAEPDLLIVGRGIRVEDA